MKRKNILLSILAIAIVVLISFSAILTNLQPELLTDDKPNTNSTNFLPQTPDMPTPKPSTVPNLNQSPTATPSNTNPTPTITPSQTPEPTATPSTPSPSPTPSPTPTATPTPTPTPTATPSPTATPTPTSSPIPQPSPIPTPDNSSVLFSNGFESGNYNAWTNIDASGVTLSVKNGMLECLADVATNGNWGYVYTWLNQTYDNLDWSWYVCFSDLPTTDGNIIGVGGIYNSAVEGNFDPANAVCAVSIVRQGDACYWRLDYVNNSAFHSITSTISVAPNTWYLIELHAIQGSNNGEIHFYLNDVEAVSVTSLSNNQNGINHVSVGGGITSDRPIAWYCDSAVAATKQIGPETT